MLHISNISEVGGLYEVDILTFSHFLFFFDSEKLRRRRFLDHHVNKNFVLDSFVLLRVFSSYHRARLPRDGHRVRRNYLSDKASDGWQATHPLA